MIKLKTTFICGEVSVTIEKEENATLREGIIIVNVLDPEDVIKNTPEECSYPEKVIVKVTDGKKVYTREFSDIVYHNPIVSWRHRDPEQLEYFWDNL